MVLIVGYGFQIRTQYIISYPDMPTPHNIVRSIPDRYDGVTLPDGTLVYSKGKEMAIGRKSHIGNKVRLVLPDKGATGGCAIGVVVNIRVGNSHIQMVHKVCKDIASALCRGVRRAVGRPVFNGIAVDQWKPVGARGVHQIAIGRAHGSCPSICGKVVIAYRRRRAQGVIMRIFHGKSLGSNGSCVGGVRCSPCPACSKTRKPIRFCG